MSLEYKLESTFLKGSSQDTDAAGLGQALSSKGVWTQHTIVLDLSLNLSSIVFIIMEKLGRNQFPVW